MPIAEVQPRFNPIDDFLFFSHIPRTAGGTFSILLNSLFLDEEQVPHSGSGSAVRDLDSYLAMTPEEWKPLRVLYSHEDFSFVRLIPKRVALTVFLRDPIKVWHVVETVLTLSPPPASPLGLLLGSADSLP